MEERGLKGVMEDRKVIAGHFGHVGSQERCAEGGFRNRNVGGHGGDIKINALDLHDRPRKSVFERKFGCRQDAMCSRCAHEDRKFEEAMKPQGPSERTL